MGNPTLSLCMIVRNEAENIGRCLASVRDVVDEIVVVDTGSIDDTAEIARSMGARVIYEDWANDFSRHRNTSLDHAAGDWILFLDADEELAPGAGEEIRRVIREGRHEAYFVLVTNVVGDGADLTSPTIRLFRNRKCFRFRGRIHEQIINAVIEHYGPASIGEAGVTIIHHGYNAGTSNIPAKIRRNMEILQSYTGEEKDGFYFFNLGTEFLRSGERKKALECWLEALKRTAPGQTYGPILVKRTISTLMELRRYRDAVEMLRYYQTVYPCYSDLYFLEALCHTACGRYAAARGCLQRVLTMPSPPPWYAPEKVLGGFTAPDLLARVEPRALAGTHPDLTVCVIGRDEAEAAGRCLQSVNEIAREIVFVDTGSTDKTPAIAYQMGAKLYHYTWCGDFAAARNFALDQATGEWVLVLDADEALPDESRAALAGLLCRADRPGYVLKIRTYLDRRAPEECLITGALRLFRRGAFRYRGAAPEEIVPCGPAGGPAPGTADIAVDHLHYLAGQEALANKRRRKAEALQRGLAGEPVRLRYALGVEHFLAREWAAAAECLRQADGLPGPGSAPAFFYYYALALINTGDHTGALDVLRRGLELFPDYTDLVYLSAVAHFMLGRDERSERLFRRCLQLGPAPWEKYVVSPGTDSFKALCSLGTLYARRGDAGQALEAFLRAAAMPPAFERAVEGLVFLRGMLSEPLEQILERDGLLNPRSLGVVSRTLARAGLYEESLRYLELSYEMTARQSPPRDFSSFAVTAETLAEILGERLGLPSLAAAGAVP